MKKIKTFPVLLCTMMLLFLPAQAERVNIEKAEKVARTYARVTPRLAARTDFRHSRTVSRRALRNLPGLRSAQQQDEPVYHVFTTTGNGGFIVIAGDDVAKPVLGYSDAGTFDESNKNLAYWMETLSQEIAGAIESGLTPDAQTKADWDALESGNSVPLRSSGDYVDPLVKTKWNQVAPYSNLCPNQWYTGCVATALAQIMKYHNYPDHGAGSHSYTPSNVGYPISANFGNAAYRWSAMTDTYTSAATGVAADAVATLMYHCGVSVNMEYGSDGSGANSLSAFYALINYFGYDADFIRIRKLYTAATWINLLKTELRNNRPVYYDGYPENNNYGHAFVCDGYDTDDLFHFNWGWGGYSDGYFAISALNPATYDFSYDQKMITGIKPKAGGMSDFQMSTGSFFANTDSLSNFTDSFTISFDSTYYTKLTTGSFSACNGNMGIWLCRQDKSAVQYNVIREFFADAPPASGAYTDFRQTYSLPGSLQPGTYILYPAYKTASTQATPSIMPGLNGEDQWITAVVNSNYTVTLSSSCDATLLAAAKTAAAAETYSVTQAVANTESGVKNRLAAQINALAALSATGITTSAGDIRFSAFTPAVSGADGHFTFTAKLTKGARNITTAGISGTIAATPVYAVTVANTVSNGSIATDKTQATAGETVTLTVRPDAGYEPDGINVQRENTETSVTHTPILNNTCTFTIPACNVAVTATFKKNTYQLAVEAAKAAIERETYTVAQAAANTPDAVKGLLVTRINSLLSGITISGANITISNFNGATAGTSGNRSGTNGSFTLTVSLQTGGSTTVTAVKPDNIITATRVYAIEGTLSHGSFAANPPEVAAAGTSVRFTLTADNGYELTPGSVAVRSAGETDGGITLAESGYVYSFTMPAGNVTIAAAFRKIADRQAVEGAKATVESGTYTVAQAQAASAADVKALLETQITARISAGITVAVTVNTFTPASAGTAGTPGGTPGSFTFTASLQSGSSAAVTGSRTGTVTATPYAGFAITVNPASHGSVSSSHTSAAVNEVVTLTVSPDAGYELNSITATSVTPGGSGNIRTFAMPAHSVTVSATFKENSDRADVMAAKAAVEGGTYSVLQTVANNRADVAAWLSGHITLPGITVSAITVNRVIMASAGTAGKLSGTAGSFIFTLMLEKGNSAPVYASASGTITPTPAYAIFIGASRNGSAGADKTAALAGETVTLTATPDAGYEPDMFLIYKTGEEKIIFTGSGNTFTMPACNVTVEAIFLPKSQITERQDVNKAADSRRVWSSGSTLYITAATAGEARVFSTDGRFVKAVPHTAGETGRTALPRGFHIVVTEGERYKVMIR
jgi:hypothetical protein